MSMHQPYPQESEEPIVAIGLLTQNDLNLLGSGFRRAFRIEDSPIFDDLLAAIDDADERCRDAQQN
jgi:hypothetical protein